MAKHVLWPWSTMIDLVSFHSQFDHGWPWSALCHLTFMVDHGQIMVTPYGQTIGLPWLPSMNNHVQNMVDHGLTMVLDARAVKGLSFLFLNIAMFQNHPRNSEHIYKAGTKVGPDQLGPPVWVGSTRINSDRHRSSRIMKKHKLKWDIGTLTHLKVKIRSKMGQIEKVWQHFSVSCCIVKLPFCILRTSSSHRHPKLKIGGVCDSLCI